MRLTRADIKRANKRRKYSDGRGLFLSVSANGRKTWAFCYTSPITGKPREMGLGSIDFMDVEDARLRAMELRKQVRSGVDPVGERKVEARAVSRRRLAGTTFREVAARLIEKKRPGWTENGRSEEAWTPVTASSQI